MKLICILKYLDVTFNLKTGKYYPYRKQSNSLQHIDKQSNHLPSIIKWIPSIISKRLSDITSDKEHFDKAAPIYTEVLKNSGFNETKSSPTILTRRHRGWNIIWFNPPMITNFKTNIGKLFSTLSQKHFPPHHKYYKLFNKNNAKISHVCLTWKVLSKIITLICYQNTPPLLQHAHPVAVKNQNAH